MKWLLRFVPAAIAVAAIYSGDVVLVDTLRSSGLTVIIDHGEGLYSMFGHLSRAAVTTGARVTGGDAIGEVSTSSAPMRWVTRLHNEDVDPLSLVYAAEGDDEATQPSH